MEKANMKFSQQMSRLAGLLHTTLLELKSRKQIGLWIGNSFGLALENTSFLGNQSFSHHHFFNC
jgi:hypothetical protein